MSNNLIALQNRFLGKGETVYDKLAVLHDEDPAALTSSTAIESLAKDMNLPPSHVHSVAQFYDGFKQAAPSSGIKVCNGEACLCQGSADLKTRLADKTGKDVGDITCLGYCDQGPAVVVEQNHNSGVYALHDDASEAAVVDAVANGELPDLSEPENAIYPSPDAKSNILLRNMANGVDDLDTARKHGAYESLKKALAMPREELLQLFVDANLRGRGGAGFPIGIKLKTVSESVASSGNDAVVVCNADEGDAGAYIDKVLLEKDPHAVLEGILLAAVATGATQAFLYLRGEYPTAIQQWKQLLVDVENANLLGDNILGSGYSCSFKLVPGHGAYVCGEETSLLRSLEGVAAQVSPKPPFPAVSGYQGRPTAVNNVETLANLPWIVEHGAEAYAALGHGKSRGTKLVSLNAAVEKPGVYEVELGTTLHDVIERAGGLKDGKKFRAAQVGGPLGGLLDEGRLNLPLDFEAYAQAGVMLGHAGVVIYTDDVDLVKIGRGLMRFCAVESCGKCFPCRLGSVRGTDIFDKILDGNGTQADLELLAELLETMQVGSLCALGGGIPTPIINLLTFFIGSFSPYIPDARVPQLVRDDDVELHTVDEVRHG